MDLIAKSMNFCAERLSFVRQRSNLFGGDRTQGGTNRFELGRDALQVLTELGALGFEAVVISLEQVVRDVKLLVLGLEGLLAVIGLIGFSLRLILGRDPHSEDPVAVLAADIVADVGAPDVQGRITVRANRVDAFDVVVGLVRWNGWPLTAALVVGQRGLSGDEGALALGAGDMLPRLLKPTFKFAEHAGQTAMN